MFTAYTLKSSFQTGSSPTGFAELHTRYKVLLTDDCRSFQRLNWLPSHISRVMTDDTLNETFGAYYFVRGDLNEEDYRLWVARVDDSDPERSVVKSRHPLSGGSNDGEYCTQTMLRVDFSQAIGNVICLGSDVVAEHMSSPSTFMDGLRLLLPNFKTSTAGSIVNHLVQTAMHRSVWSPVSFEDRIQAVLDLPQRSQGRSERMCPYLVWDPHYSLQPANRHIKVEGTNHEIRELPSPITIGTKFYDNILSLHLPRSKNFNSYLPARDASRRWIYTTDLDVLPTIDWLEDRVLTEIMRVARSNSVNVRPRPVFLLTNSAPQTLWIFQRKNPECLTITTVEASVVYVVRYSDASQAPVREEIIKVDIDLWPYPTPNYVHMMDMFVPERSNVQLWTSGDTTDLINDIQVCVPKSWMWKKSWWCMESGRVGWKETPEIEEPQAKEG